MKRVAVALCVALWCGVGGQVLAQEPPAAEEAAPSLDRFAGEYGYVGGQGQIDKMQAVVEAVVEEANFVVRGFARDKLLELCAPYKGLSVTVQGEQITMKTERYGPWTTKADGQGLKAKNSQGEDVTVTRKWQKEKLVEVVRGEGGSFTRVFQLSPDGKRLTMSVTVTSTKLDKPVKYAMTYGRK